MDLLLPHDETYHSTVCTFHVDVPRQWGSIIEDALHQSITQGVLTQCIAIYSLMHRKDETSWGIDSDSPLYAGWPGS